jgi:hypothetical protein
VFGGFFRALCGESSTSRQLEGPYSPGLKVAHNLDNSFRKTGLCLLSGCLTVVRVQCV